MSSPAELLAMKHAEALQAEEINQSPVLESATTTTESSVFTSEPSTIQSSNTDESIDGENVPTLADEISKVETTKAVTMNDDLLFPSLGGSNSTASSWGPSITAASSLKANKNSFKQAVKSTSTQVTFIIDDEQQQNLAKGEIFKIFAKIQASLNVKIESTYSSTTKRRTFLLDGPIENVALAKKELIKQLTKPTKITFEVPSKLRSTIIGSGGKTLRPIIEATSVRIDIAKESHDNDDENDSSLLTENEELFGKSLLVTVEGDIQGCTDAKARILEIVNENIKTLNVKIPVNEKVKPFVAANVAKLSFDNDVEVTCPEPSSKILTILIAGPREGVIEARNEIKTLLVTLDNKIIVDERDIPKHLHQFVNAEKIFVETNVVVEVPKDNDTSLKVKFIGLKSDIASAIELARSLTSEYTVDTLDLSKSHGGNYQHAKNLTAFFIYTKLFESLGSEYGIKIAGPSYANLADPNIHNVLVSFSASKDQKDEIKKVRKAVVDTVNRITPNFVKSVEDIESFIFPKIDNTVAIENNVSVIPLGSLAGFGNKLLLVVQQDDDEFLPSAEQIQAKLDNVDNSFASLRKLNNELITEVIETSKDDQKHLEGNTLKVLLNKYEDNTIEIKLYSNLEGSSDNEIYLRGYKTEINKAIDDIKQLIEDVKNYEEASKYNTTIEFPTKYLPRFIGQKGAHLNEIKDEFNIRIDVLGDENDKVENTEIKLTGLKSNVDECIKKIQQLAKRWADEKTSIVNIEQKYRKQLIGPNGVYANRLQDKYNVKLQFSQSDEKNGNVVIRGPSRGVAKVEEEINQLIAYEKENGFTEFIEIPTEALPRVIGKNGDNIKGIAIDAGIQIYSKNAQSEEGKESSTATLELIGSKAGIKEAKAQIDAIVKRIVNTVTETIDVDPKWYRNIIGPNGMAMRELIIKAGGSENDRDFRRFIQFPARNSDSHTITCEGDKVVVGKIITAIKKIVADLESITEQTVEVPKKQHRMIIGSGGSVRRGIEEEFKVRVLVPRQDVESDAVVVKGKAEDVAKAIAKIESLVAPKEAK